MQDNFKGPIASWVIPESWTVATGTRNGLPIIVRINAALTPLVGNRAFKTQVGIAVPLNRRTDNGLPLPDEGAQLDAIEDDICRRFTPGNQSLLVAAITTANMREFVLYTSNATSAIENARQLARELKRHQIQHVVNDDPRWSVFRALAAGRHGG